MNDIFSCSVEDLVSTEQKICRSLILKEPIQQLMSQKVIFQKNIAFKMFVAKYMELLPSIRKYSTEKIKSIDFSSLEISLKNGKSPVIARSSIGKYVFCGFTSKKSNLENDFYRRNQNDIQFFIDKKLFPHEMKEIVFYDDCQSGDFIVLKDKKTEYMSDYEIIVYHANLISEIELTRLSLFMQAKISTFFTKESEDDVDIDTMIAALYYGAPAISLTNAVDIEDIIHQYDNGNTSELLDNMKRQYQNVYSECNTMLSIPNVAVEKESGVSNVEATGNEPFTNIISDSYISIVQECFDKLNNRFGDCDVLVSYNTDTLKKIKSLENGDNNDNNNNPNDDINRLFKKEREKRAL